MTTPYTNPLGDAPFIPPLDCACLHNRHDSGRVIVHAGHIGPLHLCTWHAELWRQDQRIRDYVTAHAVGLAGVR